MGFQFNGLQASVTISGAVGVGAAQYATSQTFKTYYSSSFALDGSMQIVITPTAGKIAYITYIKYTAPAGGTTWTVDDTNNFLTSQTGTLNTYAFPFPAVVPAGSHLKVGGTNGQAITGLTVIYFEV